MADIAENAVNTQQTEQTETKATETKATETKAEVKSDSAEVKHLKELLSKVNSEAAGYKRQLREKMSADEQAEADRKAQQEALENEVKELRKQNTVNTYTAKYLSLGFDADSAADTATAMADGDTDKVFENLKTLTENIKKSAIVDALNKQQGLTVGKAPTTEDKEKSALNDLRKAMGLPTK